MTETELKQMLAKSPVAGRNNIAIMKKAQYIIGVDTGTNTGFAIYDTSIKKLTKVDTIKAHELIWFIGKLKENKELDLYHFRIEDARLRTWIPRQKNEKAERGRAAGAGSVKRDASIIEDCLKDAAASYEMVAPKSNKTKIDAEYFKKVTSWYNKTSEHSRDAAMLCFGYLVIESSVKFLDNDTDNNNLSPSKTYAICKKIN